MSKHMMTAARIDLDGRAEVIDLSAAASTGAAIRSAIGCRWFDVVRLGPDLVDDEGATLADAQINVTATTIARAHGAIRQPFCGVAVFTSHDGEGATVGLPDDLKDALLAGAFYRPRVIR
ncbi:MULTISPECIES: DUF3846 domain-containing protein [unclassified Rhodococcus (in: high G+C Gram-positive bacteria)]|uniref:DUF3846 domain-containing protein n=1 Tax=unclassified Rhodococcus (in: high G+C Gram-positive bacteria) TaxID=192944 RepID=UPI00031DCF42|nr:DUF3846 domain-containing protein [Rhodococcus sp. DK17]